MSRPTTNSRPPGSDIRRHVVISGTGRAGTTFLVELLTHLGLDTGFTPAQLSTRKDPHAQAGLEHDIRRTHVPYIVKSPSFCDIVEEVLSRDDLAIDHVLVPMRDLGAAADSRRRVYEEAAKRWSSLTRIRRTIHPKRIRGGLWHTARADRQELILLQQLYKLMLALSGESIPLTLLRFPRIVKDPVYLFDKLKPLLPGIDEDRFRGAFEQSARPNLVHTFNENDR